MIVTEVWVVTLGAVYVTETCPEEFVVPLDAPRVPETALQVTVLLVNGEPLDVSVAVNVRDSPEPSVKLDGSIERAVLSGSAGPALTLKDIISDQLEDTPVLVIFTLQ